MMGSSMSFYDRNIQQVASDDKVIHISYDNLVPGEYEKRVIFGNMCISLVRMRCIFEGNDADVFYITAGLNRFDEYIGKETESMQGFLGLILNILKAVRNCGNYLIPENEISLRSENIFFSKMNGDVRLMYLPGFSRESSLGREAVMLTERAEKLCRPGVLTRSALEEYRARLIENENDVHEMISATEEAMRRTFNVFQPSQHSDAHMHSAQAPSQAAAPPVRDHGGTASVESERRLAVRETHVEYGAGGVIKRHIREFINELVS